MVDFVRVWSEKTEISADRFIAWIGVARGKFFEWRKRYVLLHVELDAVDGPRC